MAERKETRKKNRKNDGSREDREVYDRLREDKLETPGARVVLERTSVDIGDSRINSGLSKVSDAEARTEGRTTSSGENISSATDNQCSFDSDCSPDERCVNSMCQPR